MTNQPNLPDCEPNGQKPCSTEFAGKPIRRDASRDVIDMAYRRLRSEYHPDRGGDPEKFRAIQKAYEEADKCT